MNWEQEHKKRILAISKKIDMIYKWAASESASIGASVTNFNPDKPFSFTDYPITKNRIDGLITTMNKQLQSTVVNGATAEWEQSNFKNNELAKSLLGFKSKTGAGQLDLFSPPPEAANNDHLKKYFNNNDQALKAFLTRKEGGLKLSDRVWNYTSQFKSEIEMALDSGIRTGQPAAEMAKELRQFLKEPDRVYRRFKMNLRDADGNEVLDSEGNKIPIKQLRRRYIDPATGKETWKVETPPYKPGRGVYRSSVKNAQRLARTETNMAYRTADHMRMQQFDFIVGQEISLSKSHVIYDICDILQGKYPKEFKYKGWHPHCMCIQTFILKTPEELKAETNQILNGEPTYPQSVNQVKTTPPGFNNWIDEHKDRIASGKNAVPYFVTDNFKGGDITQGLTYEGIQADKAAQAAKDMAEQNAKVQAAIKQEAEKANAAKAAAEAAKQEAIVAAKAKAALDAAIAAEKAEAEAKATQDAMIAKSKKQGENKLNDALIAGLENSPQYKALFDAVHADPMIPKTVQYRIVQMNIAIKTKKDEVAKAIIKAEEIKAAALKAEQAAKLKAEQEAIAAAIKLKKEQEAKAAVATKPLNAEVIKAQEKAAKKIAEAESYGITGKKMDALNLSSTGQNPKTIQYHIDQINIAIKQAKTAGVTPGANSVTPIVQAQKTAKAAKAAKAAKFADPLSKEALLQEFTQPEVDSLFAAHNKFLKEQILSQTDIDDKIKKLKFEIDWITTNPKYSTSLKLSELLKKDLAKYEIDQVAIQAKQAFKIAGDEAYHLVNAYTGIADKGIAKAVSELTAAFTATNPTTAGLSKATAALQKQIAIYDAKQAAIAAKQGAKQSAKMKAQKFDESQFTKARKDAALWAKTYQDADDAMRPVTKDVWKKATLAEKKAGFEYTCGSGKFNRPLRGYGSAWGDFKGIGKVSLDNEGGEKMIKDLTTLIEKSSFKTDTWLQRGLEGDGASKFLGVNISSMNDSQLNALIGKTVTDTGFISCGSAKGTGFSGNILNIYCPKGTKMIYAEPFSHYGGGSKAGWDGVSKKALGSELETIIQRNTTFRIVKIERKSGYQLYIDIEVVAQ